MTLRADKKSRNDTSPDQDIYTGGIFDRVPFWTPYVIVLIAMLGLVYAGVRAFDQSADDPASIPIVKAPDKPVKVDPEDPGGMDIPFQDALVYDELDDDKTDQQKVEKLLPEPEKPLERPAAEAPANNELTQKQAETLEPSQAEETAAMDDQPAEALLPETDKSDIQKPITRDETDVKTEVSKAAEPETNGTTTKQPMAKKTANSVIAELVGGGADQANKQDQTGDINNTQASLPRGGYIIQFGAVRDRDSAIKEFERLQSTHPNLIGSLDQRIQRADLGDKGIFYRIQGGFLTKKVAQDLCNQLQERHSVSCLVKQK
jgi:hypothetical protein